MSRRATSSPVVLYASGNLAADTMALAYNHLRGVFRSRPLRLLTDGVLMGHLPFDRPPERIDPFRAEPLLRDAAMLVSSIRSPGDEERALFRAARRVGIPTFLLLADLGSGAAKLHDEAGWSLPDRIGVADPISRSLLVDSGVPEDLVRAVGSPYLDHLFGEKLPVQVSEGFTVGFASVPNRLDFETWGTQGYCEEEVVRSLVHAIDGIPDARVTIRLHPKETDDRAYRDFVSERVTIEPIEARTSIVDFLARHRVIVSSYSTCLLLARGFGRAAVSHQPGRSDPVRSEIYEACRIPLTRTPVDLAAVLRRMQQEACDRRPSLLYHERRSLARLEAELRSLLGRKTTPAARQP